MPNKKLILTTILTALLLSLYYVGQAVGSSPPQPGSKQDPFVTRVYADNYADQRFQPLEQRLETSKTDLALLADRFETLLKSYRPSIILTLNNKTAYIGEQPCRLDAAPFVTDNRTMVPFRFIGEALGADIHWDATDKAVAYRLGGTTITMPISSKTITVNDSAQQVETAATLVDNRTFVPVRLVSEVLGAEVSYDNQTKTITVKP